MSVPAMRFASATAPRSEHGPVPWQFNAPLSAVVLTLNVAADADVAQTSRAATAARRKARTRMLGRPSQTAVR